MNRSGSSVLALVAIVSILAAACATKQIREGEPEVSGWLVFDADGSEVMELYNEPGTIASTAAPPIDFVPPPDHPFASGAFTSAQYEEEVMRIVAESKDFADLVTRLKGAGFVVRPMEG